MVILLSVLATMLHPVLFTQATIDYLTTHNFRNALCNEMIILNYTLVVTQLAIAWVINHL